jgi:hypothetical protein
MCWEFMINPLSAEALYSPLRRPSSPDGDTVFAWATCLAATSLETIIPWGFRGTLQTDG